MRWTSLLAIYFLFWCFSYMLVLPFRLQVKGSDEAYVPGQAESAPPSFSFARTAKWTTLVAFVLTGLYWANYDFGWITPDMIDFVQLKPLD